MKLAHYHVEENDGSPRVIAWHQSRSRPYPETTVILPIKGRMKRATAVKRALELLRSVHGDVTDALEAESAPVWVRHA